MTLPDAIIFTDLDGTLLDHEDYRFDAALPALHAARARGIPVIPATSKTLAEVVELGAALGQREPMLVENGGALCFPAEKTYPFPLPAGDHRDGHRIVPLGANYGQLRDFLCHMRAERGWQLRGFGDMDSDEVAARTGLTPEQAAKAKQRWFTEPFVWEGSDTDFQRLREAAQREGLRLTRGDRFHHLMGHAGKGAALERMRVLLSGDSGEAVTIVALGDSENDRTMLEAADIAVVVRNPDGKHIECCGKRQTLFTQQKGAAGWNSAVLSILKQLQPARRLD